MPSETVKPNGCTCVSDIPGPAHEPGCPWGIIQSVRERCARLEQAFETEKAATRHQRTRYMEARDRCASLEAALRELVEPCRGFEDGPTCDAHGSAWADCPHAKARALLGPSPEGSPDPWPPCMHCTYHATGIYERCGRDDCANSEPPEGTETVGDIIRGMARRTEEMADHLRSRREARKAAREQVAPSPLHGETEDEARERREQHACNIGYCRARTLPELHHGRHDLSQAGEDVVDAMTREAEALSTRTTPDPEMALRRAIIDALCSCPSDEIGGRLRRGLNEARGDAHPEDTCERCCSPFEPWAVGPELWASKTGRVGGGPILCRPCFDALPEQPATPDPDTEQALRHASWLREALAGTTYAKAWGASREHVLALCDHVERLANATPDPDEDQAT